MLVLGIDEAGRGPVAGSMFIAGVLLSEKNALKLGKKRIKDSKMLTKKEREKFFKEIKKLAVEINFIEVPALEIDQKRRIMSLNELEALKMAELIELFTNKADKIIIDLPDPDGMKFIRRIKKYITIPKTTQVVTEHKADEKYPVVSAASIIAKVHRDNHVCALEKKHGIKLRSGYSHEPIVIEFMEKYKGEFPDFIRKSWYTSRRIKDKKYQRKISDW